MKPPKSVIRLGIAVAVLFLLDMLLLLLFASIGEDSGTVYAAERFTFHPIAGDSVTLAWGANPEPDLAGYRLYAAGADTFAVWSVADTLARVRVPLTRVWETVRFRLTAVDRAGNESAPSDTVSTILCKDGPRLVGDMNADGRVNVLDKAWYWLAAGTKRGDLLYTERADFNGDGRVDVIDKGYMNLNSGRTR